MKPATAHPNRAYHVSLSPSVYSAVEQLARDTRCTLGDVLVEALSALLARCGKGTIEEIDMRCEMIRDAAHIIGQGGRPLGQGRGIANKAPHDRSGTRAVPSPQG